MAINELTRDIVVAAALLMTVLIGACRGAAVIDRPPLAFSDHQLAMLRRAAKAVPIDKRDEFLVGRSTAPSVPEPSDYACRNCDQQSF